MSGPLEGVRVVELAGIGPSPFTCMMLADAGAEVVRLERPPSAPAGPGPHWDVLNRNRRSVGIDLKHPDAATLVLDLVERADVLVEGFRPGVAERLGPRARGLLGPQPRPRLRPHDRLGPGRAAGRLRRSRHRLHRPLGRPVEHRPPR